MKPNATPAPPAFTKIGQAGVLLAVIGLLGLLISLIAAHGEPARVKNVMQSYLFGWILAILPALGCYGFMLLYYMTRGSWARPVIRLLEAGAKCLPIMFILFLPLLIWPGSLYPWANGRLVQTDTLLQHRSWYLNPTMFAIRTAVFFGIWMLFTVVQTRLSLRQDETGDLRSEAYRQKMSSFGFLIFVITLTLAFTDWIMSIDTHWFSTIYGLWFFDFCGLTAISLITLIVCRLKTAGVEPYARLITPQVTRDLGNLMLTLVMIWAYFSVSQWIIIWSGNLPEEVTFYLTRNSGTFLLVGAANIIFSFFLPFVMLLSGRNKRALPNLIFVCTLVLVMRFVDIFWVVVPVTRHPIMPLPSDAAGAAFAIGVFLVGFSYWVRKESILPRHGEEFAREAIAHA